MSYTRNVALSLTALGLLALPVHAAGQQQQEPQPMGFFITSVGIGNGGDLGGLQGADAHCQSLAAAVGAGNRTWRAYLSTQATADAAAVNARDRIGSGPWSNVNGLVMATSVESLHYDNSNFNREYSRDENGNQFVSRIDGDPDTSVHDVLTGSQVDGTAMPAGQDQTCSNWTSSTEGSARVGHADRYSFTTPGSPWNSAHGTPGCTSENLISTGGAGLFYCFAL
jgi:hypothetical protein